MALAAQHEQHLGKLAEIGNISTNSTVGTRAHGQHARQTSPLEHLEPSSGAVSTADWVCWVSIPMGLFGHGSEVQEGWGVVAVSQMQVVAGMAFFFLGRKLFFAHAATQRIVVGAGGAPRLRHAGGYGDGTCG